MTSCPGLSVLCKEAAPLRLPSWRNQDAPTQDRIRRPCQTQMPEQLALTRPSDGAPQQGGRSARTKRPWSSRPAGRSDALRDNWVFGSQAQSEAGRAGTAPPSASEPVGCLSSSTPWTVSQALPVPHRWLLPPICSCCGPPGVPLSLPHQILPGPQAQAALLLQAVPQWPPL